MIIPRVKSEKIFDGEYCLPEKIRIYTADYPAEKALKALRMFVPTVIFYEANTRAEADFIFECLPAITQNEEYYIIKATDDQIFLNYRSFAGARNGVATIAQLLKIKDNKFYFPKTVIEDYPDAKIRTVLLDPARGMIPVTRVKEFILRMAMAKFNYIHFHATENEGYVIKFDCFPQLKGPENQQYTKEEIRDLIDFADDLGIEFIPEVGFPAHAQHIVQAIPETRCQTVDGLPSPFVMCAGSEKTYDVLEKLYTETAELFYKSKYIHVGTDELLLADIPDLFWFPTWHKCSLCKAMCEREGIDSNSVTEVFYYMLRRIYKVVSKLGRRVIMWNENIDISKTPELPRDILIHFWRIAMNEDRGPVEGCTFQRFLDEGFEVINSYYASTYIEQEYDNDDDRLLVWNPTTLPESDPAYASQIVGGGPSAWCVRKHYDWTMPTSIAIYGDRLWNYTPVEDKETFGTALTRICLGINVPNGYNLYKDLGGLMQRRDEDKRMWPRRAAEDLTAAKNVLTSLAEYYNYSGRLAKEYLENIKWLETEADWDDDENDKKEENPQE